MQEQINLLQAVRGTLNTIPLVGIDAMDKLVGCANALDNVIRALQSMPAPAEETEAANGE